MRTDLAALKTAQTRVTSFEVAVTHTVEGDVAAAISSIVGASNLNEEELDAIFMKLAMDTPACDGLPAQIENAQQSLATETEQCAQGNNAACALASAIEALVANLTNQLACCN